MKGSNPPIHDNKPDNILVQSQYELGKVDEGMDEADLVVSGTYKTQ